MQKKCDWKLSELYPHELAKINIKEYPVYCIACKSVNNFVNCTLHRERPFTHVNICKFCPINCGIVMYFYLASCSVFALFKEVYIVDIPLS